MCDQVGEERIYKVPSPVITSLRRSDPQLLISKSGDCFVEDSSMTTNRTFQIPS
jgi:hypothetical protein